MAARLVDRPPLEEIAKRAAEAGAGLAAGAKAVGLANHREMLRDHAQRVRDDHEWAKQLRGQQPTVATGGGDDMGDIIVTGDLYGDAAVRALEKRQQSPQAGSPPAEQPKQNKWLLPLALAGALGTGAAAPLAVDALWPEETPPAVAPADVVFPSYDVERWVPGESQ